TGPTFAGRTRFASPGPSGASGAPSGGSGPTFAGGCDVGRRVRRRVVSATPRGGCDIAGENSSGLRGVRAVAIMGTTAPASLSGRLVPIANTEDRQMRTPTRLFLVALLALVPAACASASGGTKGAPKAS